MARYLEATIIINDDEYSRCGRILISAQTAAAVG
jgi:hypothetical protein